MLDCIQTYYILVILVCTFKKEKDWWRMGATSREKFLAVLEIRSLDSKLDEFKSETELWNTNYFGETFLSNQEQGEIREDASLRDKFLLQKLSSSPISELNHIYCGSLCVQNVIREDLCICDVEWPSSHISGDKWWINRKQKGSVGFI